MRKMIVIICGLLLMACNESETEDMNDPLIPGSGGTSNKIMIIEDELENEKIVLAGNAGDQFIVSFKRTLNDTLLSFEKSGSGLPVIMKDNEGNEWDIFGYAVEGPRKGQRLNPTQSLMGFWFSFATFYPGVQIYPDQGKGEHEGKQISGSGLWLVPENEVRSGGVGRDGIPAVSNPAFDVSGQLDFLGDKDLVVGFANKGVKVAYPHEVLDWHEIVNDELEGLSYSVIYCPLTGTATVWDRKINGKVTTFGVSGLLYNTNIVPYDRETYSNWSQLFDRAIWGLNRGTKPRNYMVLEVPFATWNKLYPGSKVMNRSTGYNRNYGNYPYGNYKNESETIFPVKYTDNRLFAKERVHAVIVNGKARVYRFDNF